MRSWSDADVLYDVALDTLDPLAALFACAHRGLPGPILADNECGTHSHVRIMPGDDMSGCELRENLADWSRSGDVLAVEIIGLA